MASFLQLVKDLGRESGTVAPSLITAVAAPANVRIEKLIEWTKQAWINIQNQQQRWRWMRAEVVVTLTIGTARYLGPGASPNFALTRWGEWIGDDGDLMPVSLYDNAIGVADEGVLQELDYGIWFARYGRGSHDSNRPIEWAISPLGEMCFGPTPDVAYKVRLAYQKTPQELSADADIPEMPTRFHRLIVMEAMRLLQNSDGNFNSKQFYTPELVEMRSHLHRDQLPEMMLAGGAVA